MCIYIYYYFYCHYCYNYRYTYIWSYVYNIYIYIHRTYRDYLARSGPEIDIHRFWLPPAPTGSIQNKSNMKVNPETPSHEPTNKYWLPGKKKQGHHHASNSLQHVQEASASATQSARISTAMTWHELVTTSQVHLVIVGIFFL